MERWLYRIVLGALLVHLLLRVPLPGVPGACVTLRDVLVILAGVTYLGKLLYDTLFQPRGPWGTQP
ncbi:MAG: hypothetical protein QHJ73_07245 [Armatimonadota bacterium]|nr:hypothetical protein [Armatimonadota bacterium]